MADPLSIAASVAGVADVGYRLSVTLVRYVVAVANPNQSILDLQPEVAVLTAVLGQLKSNLASDNLSLYNITTVESTKIIVDSCGNSLRDVEEIITRYFENTKISITDRMKRYQKEKEVNVIRANLERQKSAIVLMLGVIQYARNIVGNQHGDKERDSEILLKLQEAKEEAEEKYNSLLKAIEHTNNLVGGVLANLDISNSNFGAKIQSYSMIDKSGTVISGGGRNAKLASKAARITSLINEIEAAQGDFFAQSGIWEKSEGKNGHYRNTVISKHPNLPQIPGFESVRSIDGPQDLMVPMAAMAPIAHQMTNLYIALMGAVGVGKSTFVNLCCGESLAPISQGTEHCTDTIGEYHFMYNPEIRIHLLDTPGFNDGHRTEREILTDLAEWMSQSRGPNARLSGIIYFHRISELGMKVSAHRNLRLFEKLCGLDAFHSIILATTNWNSLGDPNTAVMHEQELHTRDEYWGLMLRRGSSVVRHTGDRDSAMQVLGTLGPLHHAKPLQSSYDQQPEPWERKRGFSEAGLAKEAMSNEARVNQLLAQYTVVVEAPPTVRRWSVDPIF